MCTTANTEAFGETLHRFAQACSKVRQRGSGPHVAKGGLGLHCLDMAAAQAAPHLPGCAISSLAGRRGRGVVVSFELSALRPTHYMYSIPINGPRLPQGDRGQIHLLFHNIFSDINKVSCGAVADAAFCCMGRSTQLLGGWACRPYSCLLAGHIAACRAPIGTRPSDHRLFAPISHLCRSLRRARACIPMAWSPCPGKPPSTQVGRLLASCAATNALHPAHSTACSTVTDCRLSMPAAVSCFHRPAASTIMSARSVSHPTLLQTSSWPAMPSSSVPRGPRNWWTRLSGCCGGWAGRLP